MDVESVLNKLQERESKLAHVEFHNVRAAFISTVAKRVREDKKFEELVGRQLGLYCNVPDPRTFCAVCNEPGHLVRERLIVWCIDHPGSVTV